MESLTCEKFCQCISDNALSLQVFMMSTLEALSLVMLDHSMLLPIRQRQQLKEKADCVNAHLLQGEDADMICLCKQYEQESGAHAARRLLGLPMSRRERLQLTNKERARSERRARARKRRIDPEEDTDVSGKPAKPRGEP